MKAELYEHRPTVVTVEAVTDEVTNNNYDLIASPGDLKVTDEQGVVEYMSVADFEANYKPKSPIKELGHMKLPNYPGSTVKLFAAPYIADLEKQINSYFHEGLNALVLEQHYFTAPSTDGVDGEVFCAAFTLNTVVSDDEVKERTEIQKIADEEYQKRLAEKAKVNEKAIDIAKKLSAERQAEEDRKRKQLLEDAELGKKCRNNHGKLAKGKK